jgi:hypothetical protein
MDEKKDLTPIEEISIKKKIFNFYFYTLRKKDLNKFFYIILFIIETLQLISYTFSTPHLNNWNISENKMDDISMILGSVRFTPLLKYIKFDVFIIIFIIICSYVFIHCLLLAMTIKFNDTNGKIYQIIIIFTRYFTPVLTIFLMIPFEEILLFPLKCKDGYMTGIKDPKKCWNGIHYLYSIIGIIFAFALYLLITLSTFFYFNPFYAKNSTTKISTTADAILYLAKIILVVRFIFLKDEYVSCVIMLLLSMFILSFGFGSPTYSNLTLECFLCIRNVCFFWSNFVLLINLIAKKHLNGNVYLLLIGFPLIITFSIMIFRTNKIVIVLSVTNLTSVKEFNSKCKQLITLIEEFFERNNVSKSNSNKKNEGLRSQILLKGAISIHEESCIDEDCPLKKFLENENNFPIQKTSLLHYMNNYFNIGIKKFPNSRVILLNFVQFNYENKYNLSQAKNYLAKLEKTKNSLLEDYIIHYIKTNIASVNLKINDNNNNNNDFLKVEETIEQKYFRLKTLIEKSTKLYGEFWGILAANLTNKMNLNKLFIIGSKLNKFLREISDLWDNELKNKKIDIENQSTAILYSNFCKEILRNKRKTEEIQKKLNEEQHFESRKIDENKFDINNLDFLLENQDYVIFSRTNEKGEATIIQCSNSIVLLLGYLKQDLIGSPIETLMPVIYAKDHKKMMEERLKSMHNQLMHNKDNFRAADKKQTFLVPKTKVGYLIPMNCRFTIYNDDDFSNTYIVKCKYESKDTKSVYAFYVLTKDDFTVDSISSSAINLGLSMDLLKKYVINLNILVRSEDNLESIDLREKFTEFEEEPKKITWVFPDIIYPKNDSEKKKEENINELIKISKTKEFLLWIKRVKYNENEILGYIFRFTEIIKQKNLIDANDFILNTKKTILFNVLKLSYIRTNLINERKGINLAEENRILSSSLHYESLNQNSFIRLNSKKSNALNKKTTRNLEHHNNNNNNHNNNNNSNNVSDDEKPKENLLTKEKILEMSQKRVDEIKTFILSLNHYGEDVNLEKHRPNKEKYPVGKQLEPSINLNMNQFIKRIEDKLKQFPYLKKKLKNNNSKIADVIQSSDENEIINSNEEETKDSIENPQEQLSITSSMASELSTNSSSALSTIFNEKSVFYIKISSFIFFILILFEISLEFFITLNKINNVNDRIKYMDKAFIMLNTLMYTKFFITEAIFANLGNYKNIDYNLTNSEYIKLMMKEMANYREIFSNTWLYYSNATVTFSDEYFHYTENTNVNIKTISNKKETIETQQFSIAMSRIPTSIFYVSTVTDNVSYINITDRNCYELMHNLLNDYLIVWRNVTFILVDDVKNNTKKQIIIIIIFVVSFLLAIAGLILMWNLLLRFIEDREKPIDLFLTIKKKIFEELKNSSENFGNKLLNRFFGNEDNDEDAVVEVQTIIKKDDINIVKFKTKNKYKNSSSGTGKYLLNYLKMIIFFTIIEIYMIFKFFYNNSNLNNMDNYSDIYNVTQYCQSDLILSLNIIKSFYFNESIEILNNEETFDVFLNDFISLTDSFKYVFLTTYQTSSFLENEYMNDFYNNINTNITSIANTTENDLDNNHLYLGTLEHGFKSVIARYFELLRYVAISYFNNKIDDNSSDDELWNYEEFREINSIVRYVIRPWFDTMIHIMNDELEKFVNNVKVINISTYVVLLCLVLILYCLVWRSYEASLSVLLKTSVDLITLIPEEIKYQIVLQLNEEENNSQAQ